jgi:serine/threonine protein kinase
MVVNEKLKLSPDFGWSSQRRSIYDAPEAGTGHSAPAADIWSLGILLVEALSQQLPSWDRSQGSEPVVPFTVPEPFFTIARECLQVDPGRRCTLAAIKMHLDPPQTAEEVVEVQSFIDDSTKPYRNFRAMIVAGAVLALFFFIAAFKFGYDLTPSDPLSLLKFPAPAQAAAQHQSPAPTAAAPHSNGIVNGSVTH